MAGPGACSHKVMDLDEAEAYMQSRERRNYAVPTRLGAAMAKGKLSGLRSPPSFISNTFRKMKVRVGA